MSSSSLFSCTTTYSGGLGVLQPPAHGHAAVPALLCTPHPHTWSMHIASLPPLTVQLGNLQSLTPRPCSARQPCTLTPQTLNPCAAGAAGHQPRPGPERQAQRVREPSGGAGGGEQAPAAGKPYARTHARAQATLAACAYQPCCPSAAVGRVQAGAGPTFLLLARAGLCLHACTHTWYMPPYAQVAAPPPGPTAVRAYTPPPALPVALFHPRQDLATHGRVSMSSKRLAQLIGRRAQAEVGKCPRVSLCCCACA